MKGFLAALANELIKIRKSKLLLGTIIFFTFLAVMIGLMTLLVRHPEVTQKLAILNAKTSIIERADWPSYFWLLFQIVLTAGHFGFGIVASWVFGREFTDRVIKDLLALPVSRSVIVCAKFTAVIVWNFLLVLLFLSLSLIIGGMIGLSDGSTELIFDQSVRFLVCALLAISLSTPLAFFASISRGYLLPIGIVILSLIVTQVSFVSLPTIVPYVPWAVPALYVNIAGEAALPAQIASYLILAVTSLGGIAGTIAWWRFADHT